MRLEPATSPPLPRFPPSRRLRRYGGTSLKTSWATRRSEAMASPSGEDAKH